MTIGSAWSFGSIGWNDAALYGIAIIGIILVILIHRLKLENTTMRVIVFAIFVVTSFAAALVSSIIKVDSVGTLFTRALLFEAISVFIFLGERFNKEPEPPQHKEVEKA